MKKNTSTKKDLDLRKVYPELTPEQLNEAEFYLSRYFDLARRIYLRINGLTGPDEDDTL